MEIKVLVTLTVWGYFQLGYAGENAGNLLRLIARNLLRLIVLNILRLIARNIFLRLRAKEAVLRAIPIAHFARKPAKLREIDIVARKPAQIARNKIWVARHTLP